MRPRTVDVNGGRMPDLTPATLRPEGGKRATLTNVRWTNYYLGKLPWSDSCTVHRFT